MAIYKMHPSNPDAVIISDPWTDQGEYALDRANLRQAISNIKSSRKDYATQEAYDRALAIVEGALKFLDAQKTQERYQS